MLTYRDCRPENVPVGEVYWDSQGKYYLRTSDDSPGRSGMTRASWKMLTHEEARWIDRQNRRHAQEGLSAEERAYLKESLGLGPDVELN